MIVTGDEGIARIFDVYEDEWHYVKQ